MFRGSTPLHIFQVNRDLRDAAAIYITYHQGTETILEMDKNRLTITETELRVRLSQQETLCFTSGRIAIQIRYVMPDGTADASCILSTTAEAILKDGEIA